MAPILAETRGSEDERGRGGLPLFLTGGTIGVGLESEECDPISEREFRTLLTFVAVAALAFACIVNGWLI